VAEERRLGPVYSEWQTLLDDTNDGALFAAMLGRDEHSNRLRQSPPYVGLLRVKSSGASMKKQQVDHICERRRNYRRDAVHYHR